MSESLRRHFADYAACHRTPGNKACHMLGIPLIVLTLFGLLGQLPLVALPGYVLTTAELLLVGALAFYLSLDRTLALIMLPVALVLLVAGRQLPWPWAAGLFVFGWVLQFIGHYAYEKQNPAFFRSLGHLLIGPLWILARAVGRA